MPVIYDASGLKRNETVAATSVDRAGLHGVAGDALGPEIPRPPTPVGQRGARRLHLDMPIAIPDCYLKVCRQIVSDLFTFNQRSTSDPEAMRSSAV